MELFSNRRWTTGSAQQSNLYGMFPFMCCIIFWFMCIRVRIPTWHNIYAFWVKLVWSIILIFAICQFREKNENKQKETEVEAYLKRGRSWISPSAKATGDLYNNHLFWVNLGETFFWVHQIHEIFSQKIMNRAAAKLIFLKNF